jgi:hypothetical protein
VWHTPPVNTPIPEERQAAALRAVIDAADRRARLLDQADAILNDEIRPHALDAVKAGADRSRVQRAARVGVTAWYRWLKEAGLPVRTKRQPQKGRSRD